MPVVVNAHADRPRVVAESAEWRPLVVHHLDVLELDVDGRLALAGADRPLVRPCLRPRVTEMPSVTGLLLAALAVVIGALIVASFVCKLEHLHARAARAAVAELCAKS